MPPVALLSAYSKYRLADFARELRATNWDLIASSGTAKHLLEQGIPVRDVSEFVGEPILGHKVVTLSRAIMAGLLADDSPAEEAELRRINMPRIELVYVNLYPLESEIENPQRTLKSVLEKTDIGGPTMLRAAAKGRRYVLQSSVQFKPVLDFIRQYPQPTSLERRRFVSNLAYDAEMVASLYSKISADFLYLDAYGGTL